MGICEICLWEISSQTYLENLKGKGNDRRVIAGIRRVVIRSPSSRMLFSVDWEFLTDVSWQIVERVFKCQAILEEFFILDFFNLEDRVKILSQPRVTKYHSMRRFQPCTILRHERWHSLKRSVAQYGLCVTGCLHDPLSACFESGFAPSGLVRTWEYRDPFIDWQLFNEGCVPRFGKSRIYGTSYLMHSQTRVLLLGRI